MTREVFELWDRAAITLRSARTLQAQDPNNAVVMAYYAAFYGMSAFFLLAGQSFSRHQAVEAAVHRDLARTGRISMDLAAAYTQLHRLRGMGSYGVGIHVSPEEAADAIASANRILQCIQEMPIPPFPPLFSQSGPTGQ